MIRFARFLFAMTLLTPSIQTAIAAERTETGEMREAVRLSVAPKGAAAMATPIRATATAVVNFMDLARQEALFGPPAGAVRAKSAEEEVVEPLEPFMTPSLDAMLARPPFQPLVASPSPTQTFQGLDDIAMVDSSYIVIPPDVG